MISKIGGWLSALFLLVVLGTGCTPRYIKGSKVPATEKNVAVMRVVKQYRYRFMNKQWKKLLHLVSPHFYETGGSTGDRTKHYGYASLRKKLLDPEMNKVRIIRFKLHVDDINYPNEKEAHVLLRKAFTYLVPRGDYRPELKVGSIRHKMILTLEQGRWLIRRW